MSTTAFIPGLTGPGEVLVVVIVILLLFFGARRLPELSRALGKSVNEFKKGREEEPDAEETNEEPPDEEKKDEGV